MNLYTEQGKEESSQHNQALLEINIILDDTSTGGDSGSEKKSMRSKSLLLPVFQMHDMIPSHLLLKI
jgi:hypothetical protein